MTTTMNTAKAITQAIISVGEVPSRKRTKGVKWGGNASGANGWRSTTLSMTIFSGQGRMSGVNSESHMMRNLAANCSGKKRM